MLNNSETTRDDLPYWVALAHCLKLGPARFSLLRRSFTTMRQAWEASTAELKAAALDAATVRALDEHRQTADVEKLWQQLTVMGIEVFTIADEYYPKLLKEIYDPPPVLFYRGDLGCLARPCLAVVGTRQATTYGRRAADELTSELAAAGFVIVSGLAYGIDAIAHRATLRSHGTTVAVLANGLDTVYPTAHRDLAHDIVAANGLLLSEFPPGVPALKQHFPQRNRTIAGLARATLVIEGARESGALITARSALESNRDVMALPGSIFSDQSQGTNDLLKAGAHLVTSANDVLAVLGVESITRTKLPPPSAAATALLNYLNDEPMHVDELARSSGVAVADLMAQLTALELSGYVREVGGNRYIKLA